MHPLQNKLSALMTQNGLSQSAFARAINVSQSAVNKWLSGAIKPSPKKMLAVARLFNVDVSMLKDDNAPMRSPLNNATKSNEKLKALMRRKGYSQSKIAELTGVSQKAVSNWIAGKFSPKPSTILKLSDLLDVPVDVLATEQEIPNPSINEHASIGVVLAELQKQNAIMQELLVVLTKILKSNTKG